MSDGVTIAIITSSAGTVGTVLLYLVRRFVRPRKPSAGDIDMRDLWKQVRSLRTDVDKLVDERDAYRTTARILSDGYDALYSAVSRANPPIVFTAAEQAAIDRATARRVQDDLTWPTMGTHPTSSSTPPE